MDSLKSILANLTDHKDLEFTSQTIHYSIRLHSSQNHPFTNLDRTEWLEVKGQKNRIHFGAGRIPFWISIELI